MPKPGSRPTIHSRLVAIACLLGLVLLGLPPLAAYADSSTPRQHDGVASAEDRQTPLPADAAVPARWKGVRDDALSRVEQVRTQLESGSLASAVRAAADLANISLDAPVSPKLSLPPVQAPPEIATTVGTLIAAVEQADSAARSAITADGTSLLRLKARTEKLLSDFNAELLSDKPGHGAAKRMEATTAKLDRGINRQAMYSAALALADAIDQAMPVLQAYARTMPSSTQATEGCDVLDDPQLCIGGPGANTYEADEALLIDLGGEDVYHNSAGGADAKHLLDIPGGNGLITSVNIDLGGNDFYDAKLLTASGASLAQGASFAGLGILVDAAGNDTYAIASQTPDAAGQGYGVIGGVGVLQDLGGNDSYRVTAPSVAIGQGAADPIGAGMLVDQGSSDDSYSVESNSLAMGVGYAVNMGSAVFADGGGTDAMDVRGSGYAARGFGTAVVNAYAVALTGVGDTTWSASVGSAEPLPYLASGFGNHVWALGWAWKNSLGALSDAGGDDTYSATVASLGELRQTVDDACECEEDDLIASAAGGIILAGGFGINGGATGLLHDGLGNDRYDFAVTSIADAELEDRRTSPPGDRGLVARATSDPTRIWGQGRGSDAGAGLLLDDAGDDVYRAVGKSKANAQVTQSSGGAASAARSAAEAGNSEVRVQGFGQWGGYGELRDKSGTDTYIASASSDAIADEENAGIAETRAQGAVGSKDQFWTFGNLPSVARFIDVGDAAADTLDSVPARPACFGTRGAGLWRDCGYGDGVGFNPGQTGGSQGPPPEARPPSSCPALFTDSADDASNDAPAGDEKNLDYLDIVGGTITQSSDSNMTVEIQVKDLQKEVPNNATYVAWYFHWSYKGQKNYDFWANAVIEQDGQDPSYAVGQIIQGGYYATDKAIGLFNPGPDGTIEISIDYGGVLPAPGERLTKIHASTWLGQGPPPGTVRRAEENFVGAVEYDFLIDRGPNDASLYGRDHIRGTSCETAIPDPAPDPNSTPDPEACPPLFLSPADDAPNNAPAGNGKNLNNLDVVSGDIDSAGPQQGLRATIRLNELGYEQPDNATSIAWYLQWSYGGTDYWAGVTLPKRSTTPVYATGTVDSGNYQRNAVSTGSFNTADDTVQIDVPLASVGEPSSGAVLTNTYATTWVGLGAQDNALLFPIDRGPKEEATYGRDYVMGSRCGEAGSPAPSATPRPEESSAPRGSYPVVPDDPYFGPGQNIRDLPVAQSGTQWGPQKINAPQSWQEDQATGYRIKVAVLDTGVDVTHPDLACPGKLEVVAGSDVISNDDDPDDENGHGSHVAGIIGACTNNGVGIAGVAPDVTIMPIRVLDDEGSGTGQGLIDGIKRATEAGADIINLSLGFGDVSGTDLFYFQEIDKAIEAATAQGVVIVAAAGNDSFPLCEYPSLAEDVICVGATDPRDNKSWYSTFANKAMRGGPALVAPGGTGTVFCDLDSEEILSLWATDRDETDPDDDCDGRPGYESKKGTSMATPHVAGVAALVYDRLGGVRSPQNAAKVVNALTSTAVDLGVPGSDPVYGSGRVDALAAVRSISVMDPDPSASPSTDPSASPTTDPSASPSSDPSASPSSDPSASPSSDPSASPSSDPSESPSTDPSESPSSDPSASPSTDPSASPSTDPSASPSTDPGPVAPEAPSNLTAKAASSSRIELAWTDNSSSESGFTIERSLDGSQWSEIGTAGRNATTYLDMGLDPDSTYSYRVRALNPSGYSPYSNTASATTASEQAKGAGSASAPAAPSGLNASSSSPSRVELTWADNSGNEDGFALERSLDGGSSWQEIATTGRNQSSYLDSGLAASSTYHYRLRAYNSAGHSPYSNTASATTQKEPSGGEPSPQPTEEGPAQGDSLGTATTTISASRSVTRYNQGFELSGTAQRDANCSGPLEVQVSRRTHGTDSYEAVASTPVSGAGSWGLQVVAEHNASYVAQVKKTDTCQGQASAPVDVSVKAKIGRVKLPRSCGGTIRGRVAPSYEGTTVVLQQRKKRGGWKKVDRDVLDARSRFALSAKKCGVHRVMWQDDQAANEAARHRFRL